MDSNKGFNLSSQLLAAVSFDVFLSFPLLFFFPYLFHHFSIACIPSGCVCMHLAAGREGEEESQFFPPQAFALISPSCGEAAPACLPKGQRSVPCLQSAHLGRLLLRRGKDGLV